MYEVRKANGDTCCSSENPANFCTACQQHLAVEDSYAPGIAALRAANAADDEPALRSMAAFRDSFFDLASTSRTAAHTPATSDAHLVPPDPYSEEALQAWRR